MDPNNSFYLSVNCAWLAIEHFEWHLNYHSSFFSVFSRSLSSGILCDAISLYDILTHSSVGQLALLTVRGSESYQVASQFLNIVISYYPPNAAMLEMVSRA